METYCDSRFRTGTLGTTYSRLTWSTCSTHFRTTTLAPYCSINRYYDPSTESFISDDPYLQRTDQAYVFVNDDPLNGTDPLGKDSAGFLFVRHCDASPACKNAPFTWDEIASITMIVIGLTTIVASGGVTATLIPMLAEDISGPSATTFSAAMAIAHGAYVLAPSVAATAGAMGVVVQALRMAFTEASKTISPVKQKKK